MREPFQTSACTLVVDLSGDPIGFVNANLLGVLPVHVGFASVNLNRQRIRQNAFAQRAEIEGIPCGSKSVASDQRLPQLTHQ